MFYGFYIHKVSNNSVVIPNSFRNCIPYDDNIQKVVLNRLNGVIIVITANKWKLIENLLTSDSHSKNFKAIKKFFLEPACEVTVDKHNRIKIPEYLTQYIHLEEKAIFAGQVEYFQISSIEDWNNPDFHNVDSFSEYIKNIIFNDYSIMIEQNILRNILLDSNSMNSISDILPAHYFKQKPNQLIYQALLQLHQFSPIDMVTAINRLHENSLLSEIGIDYIVSIINSPEIDYHIPDDPA